jgi:hypothetical protein
VITDSIYLPPAKDQRGVSRPQDGDGNPACDVGSYEFIFTGQAVQAPQEPIPLSPVVPDPVETVTPDPVTQDPIQPDPVTSIIIPSELQNQQKLPYGDSTHEVFHCFQAELVGEERYGSSWPIGDWVFEG